MTDEKKIEEQAPEQGEEKVEAVVLDENVLEQLLVGCIWDVLRRMHRVATKAITVYVCRTFLHGIYDMVRTLTKADEMTPEKLSETVNSTAALWTLRFTGRRADKLN